MSKLDWTKEDATYNVWYDEAKHCLFSWQWKRIKSKHSTLRTAYVEGKTIRETIAPFRQKKSITNL